MIESNPAARLCLPGSAKAQERYLGHEEYAALRDHLPTGRDQLAIEVLVGTGMRPGEAAGLHWNRLDLDRGVLRVVETFDQDGAEIKAYPKGRSATYRSRPSSSVLCARSADAGSEPGTASWPAAESTTASAAAARPWS